MAVSSNGSASSLASSGSSQTVALTTTSAGIVLLFAYAENGTPPVISGVTGGSLTFARRKRQQGSTRGMMELWWAYSAAALSAVTFTVAYSAGYDNATLIALGVAGTSTTAPFDTNASFPAVASDIGTTWTPTFSGLTSNFTGGLLVASHGVSDSQTSYPGTAPTGFTNVANRQNSGGSFYAFQVLSSKAVSAALSAASIAWGRAYTTGTGGEGILDFLVDPSTAVGGGGGGGGSGPNGPPAVIVMG